MLLQIYGEVFLNKIFNIDQFYRHINVNTLTQENLWQVVYQSQADTNNSEIGANASIQPCFRCSLLSNDNINKFCLCTEQGEFIEEVAFTINNLFDQTLSLPDNFKELILNQNKAQVVYELTLPSRLTEKNIDDYAFFSFNYFMDINNMTRSAEVNHLIYETIGTFIDYSLTDCCLFAVPLDDFSCIIQQALQDMPNVLDQDDLDYFYANANQILSKAERTNAELQELIDNFRIIFEDLPYADKLHLLFEPYRLPLVIKQIELKEQKVSYCTKEKCVMSLHK